MGKSDMTYGRREFLRAASAGALGAVAVGCTLGATATKEAPTAAPAAATSAPPVVKAPPPTAPPTVPQAAPLQQAVEPRIDRVLKNGVLRVGVDLTFPPIQFRDAATNEPKGYMAEIDKLMAQDLGVKLEYVEMPFASLIAGLQADKFDWIGIAFTSTPKRAQQVLFIDEPAFMEDSFLLFKKGFKIKNLSDLNNPNVTMSNQVGSAQDASARLMFPNTKFKPLEFPEFILDVAAGRSDACLVGIWSAAKYLYENPGSLDIWEGGSLFADVNTFYVPLGDYKTKEWMGTWFRYYGAHRWQQNQWNFWMSQVTGYTELQAKFGTK